MLTNQDETPAQKKNTFRIGLVDYVIDNPTFKDYVGKKGRSKTKGRKIKEKSITYSYSFLESTFQSQGRQLFGLLNMDFKNHSSRSGEGQLIVRQKSAPSISYKDSGSLRLSIMFH